MAVCEDVLEAPSLQTRAPSPQPSGVKSISAIYADLLARVLHHLVGFIGGIHANPVVLANKNHSEAAIFQHARKLSLAFADRQGLTFIVPMQRDGRVGALFIVVIVVLVFIEGKVSICARVDSQLHGICRLLGRPFFIRSERNDRSRPHIKWQPIEWGDRIDKAAALAPCSRPEVVPTRFWQVDRTRRNCRLRDWI